MREAAKAEESSETHDTLSPGLAQAKTYLQQANR
jgi:hypothetical protein